MSEFLLYIKDGAITNKSVVRNRFVELKDGCYLITIKSKKKRSIQQNRYLHGVLIPMVFDGLRNAGFDEIRDHEDAKFIIKNLFLKQSIVSKETGEVIEIIKRTSELTTIEMNVFYDEVIRWAATYLSIQIPYPNEPLVMFAEYDNETKSIIVK